MSEKRILFALVLSLSVIGVAQGGTITYPLDPMSSFLLASPEDNPASPLFISLSDLQLHAGQQVTLRVYGSISYFTGLPESFSLPLHVYDLAVFTVDNSLEPTTSLNRLTAVGSGPPAGGNSVIDVPTYYGGLSTDIPQDFELPFGSVGVTVTIPDGANFLVVAIRDNYYADNNNPSGDLALDLEIIPEPGTCALIVIGLSGIFALYRRQAHRRPEN